MTQLPVHPRTKLTAIGLRRDGRPIWPVMGGDGTTPPPDPSTQQAPAEPTPAAQAALPGMASASGQPAPKPDPAPGDEPLGEGGKKALEAERERRKAAEAAAKAQAETHAAQMAELKKQLEAVQPAAEFFAEFRKRAVPAEEKTDTERLQEELAQLRQTAESERTERFRAEVAAEKGLTREQAARLVGKTREELVADADALLALFPRAAAPEATPQPAPAPNGQPAPPPTPQVPRPDPTQGARGPIDLNAQIRDAIARGDVKTSIALKRQLAAQNRQ